MPRSPISVVVAVVVFVVALTFPCTRNCTDGTSVRSLRLFLLMSYKLALTIKKPLTVSIDDLRTRCDLKETMLFMYLFIEGL